MIVTPQDLPDPEIRQYPQVKIVCVGLNKTGTTSFGDAMEALGYRRLGWRPNISSPLMLRWHEGHFGPFARQLAQYDVFEDLPWCLVWREVDALYPNARFVLTRRRSEEAWLRSMQGHLSRTGRWIGSHLLYGSYDASTDPERYLAVYRRHNEELRAHFRGRPDKLLEISFDEGHGWPELCGFLGIEPPEKPFPHANKSPTAPSKITVAR